MQSTYKGSKASTPKSFVFFLFFSFLGGSGRQWFLFLFFLFPRVVWHLHPEWSCSADGPVGEGGRTGGLGPREGPLDLWMNGLKQLKQLQQTSQWKSSHPCPCQAIKATLSLTLLCSSPFHIHHALSQVIVPSQLEHLPKRIHPRHSMCVKFAYIDPQSTTPGRFSAMADGSCLGMFASKPRPTPASRLSDSPAPPPAMRARWTLHSRVGRRSFEAAPLIKGLRARGPKQTGGPRTGKVPRFDRPSCPEWRCG